MTQPLPPLTDTELRCCPPDDAAGFGALATTRGHVPLEAMDVHARIDGLLAQVTVSQTFVNTLDEPLEATYIFPLPARAAVTGFRLEVAGRVVEGDLKERAEARRDYEQALQAGHRAGIAEQERSDVFTVRVGNLPPGEAARVRLALVQPLAYSDGEATFRFPLVVAPRYIPGRPLPGSSVGAGTAADTDAVPDASRITPPVLLPGYPNPVRLALKVDVHPAGLPLAEFRSSLHAVVTEEAGNGVRRIVLQPGERLNRDFILRFRCGAEAVKTALTVQPDADGDGATLLLTLVPPVGQSRGLRCRDVAFVLDRSGSMGGWKMVAARRALARMVDTLNDKDRFAVYAFDDDVETPPELGGGLSPATDRNRFRAVEFLARIEARGGTEMARPLDRAVKELAVADPGRDRILVLVTDGQVGHEDQILRTLGEGIRDVRVFTLGIDRAVNDGFLRKLAALGGGSCEVVESEDRLDEVMDKVHRRIGTPVLTGLRLEADGPGLDSDSLVPSRLPDLFAGAPLSIMGRCRKTAAGPVVLRASDALGRTWSETVRPTVSDNPAVSCVWARGHIRELEDRVVLGRGDRGQLERHIVHTSLRFGVLCRFTAFVAVDKSEVVNKGGEVHRVTQPVEAPDGWAMLGTDPPEAGDFLCYSLEPSAAVVQRAIGGSAPRHRPAGQPVAKARRLMSKLFGSALEGQPKQESVIPPAPERVDLSAYRKRAFDLLKGLKAKRAEAAVARLLHMQLLAIKIAELIEDLKSVKGPASEIRPLENLADDLRKALTKRQPDDAALARLWAQAEQALEAFGVTAATAAASQQASALGRPEDFWK